ncbi:hypothetical protein OLJ78_004107 [Salmonella enterica]|nr:hypothetical protein [Salmonella enterica]
MLKKPPEIGGLTHKIRKIVFSYFRCPVFAFSVSRFSHCGGSVGKGGSRIGSRSKNICDKRSNVSKYSSGQRNSRLVISIGGIHSRRRI